MLFRSHCDGRCIAWARCNATRAASALARSPSNFQADHCVVSPRASPGRLAGRTQFKFADSNIELWIVAASERRMFGLVRRAARLCSLSLARVCYNTTSRSPCRGQIVWPGTGWEQERVRARELVSLAQGWSLAHCQIGRHQWRALLVGNKHTASVAAHREGGGGAGTLE